MDVSTMSIPELHAAHQARDQSVQQLRQEMGAIHDEICRKESLARVPSDPRLLQGMSVPTDEGALRALYAKLKAQFEGKKE